MCIAGQFEFGRLDCGISAVSYQSYQSYQSCRAPTLIII